MMPLHRQRQQKGQAMVEYAVVAATILLAFVVSVGVTQRLMGVSLYSTMQGLNSPQMSP